MSNKKFLCIGSDNMNNPCLDCIMKDEFINCTCKSKKEYELYKRVLDDLKQIIKHSDTNGCRSDIT